MTKILGDDELKQAQDDWIAARDTRQPRETIWKRNYKTYRTQSEETEAAAREMGWANIKVPMILAMVETARPRLAVQPPTITCNAKSPAAVPYAMAKQMRLQHFLKQGCSERELFDITSQILIYGSAPAKVPYIRDDRRPKLLSVPLFDFFLSPEALRTDEAEVIWHRSWYTRRQLRKLAEQKDADGHPIWHNLDAAWDMGPSREAADSTYAERRSASGQGTTATNSSTWQVPVVEGWYSDGTYIALAGAAGEIPLRYGKSPFYRRTESGDRRYIRPFVMFSNTPDIESPWGISLVEILEDHEAMLSTMANQHLDQATANINAGVVHDDQIPAQDVAEFLRKPGGQLPVHGFADVRSAIQRLQPGVTSQDFPQIFEMYMRLGQQVSGVNDVTQGQVVGNDQTATEVALANQEVNKRFAMLIRYVESGMGQVARLMDGHDRQFRADVEVPVEQGFQPPNGALGFQPAEPAAGGADLMSMMAGQQAPPAAEDPYSAGFAKVGPEVNQEGAEYDFEVDAGSTALPGQLDQARKMNMLIGDLSNPAIAPLIAWPELAKQLIEAHGFSPEKILVPPGPVMGAPMDPNAPPVPGPDGMVPVGPPEPVDPSTNGAPPAPVMA